MRSQTHPQTTSSLTSFIRDCAKVSTSRYIVFDAMTNWSDSVRARLDELVSLPNNWDGYNGKHVSFENANFAYEILDTICPPEHDAPAIVPGSSGDLQIEWHTTHGDLELHVIAPGHVKACYSVLGNNPVDGDLELTFEFAKVAEILGSISEAPIAVVESAV